MNLREFLLPPNHTLRIDFDPAERVGGTVITVFRGGEFLGEISGTLEHLDKPDVLQPQIDAITKRGVRG